MPDFTKSAVARAFDEMLAGIPQRSIVGKGQGMSNDLLAGMFAKNMAGRIVYDRAIGSFWIYSDGYWSPINDFDDIRKPVAVFMARLGQLGATMGKLEDIIGQVRLKCDSTDDLDDRWICFSDLIWSPETGETAKPHPSRIATLHIPVPFGDIAGSDCPKFRRYLAETCITEQGEPDPNMTAQLQEFAGYLLWPRIETGPCMFFYGEGSNGKSVFIDVMKGLVGRGRTSSCGLEQLIGDKFGMSALSGIRFNASDEMGNCREATTGDFKKMVFGDPVRAQRKFKDGYELIPKAKFIFSTNRVPAFSEVNMAIKRRILIIPFYRTLDPFSEEGRKSTIKHLGKVIVSEELPGVVKWAMEGLERLKRNDFWFTKGSGSDEMMGKFEAESSSVVEFLRETCEADAEGKMRSDSIYDDYVDWSKKAGRKAVSRISFGRDFGEVFGKSTVVKENGKCVRVFKCRKKEIVF